MGPIRPALNLPIPTGAEWHHFAMTCVASGAILAVIDARNWTWRFCRDSGMTAAQRIATLAVSYRDMPARTIPCASLTRRISGMTVHAIRDNARMTWFFSTTRAMRSAGAPWTVL